MAFMAPAFGALKYVPAKVGIDLLKKINPKFKGYFSDAASYGIDATRALNYLSEQFDSEFQQGYKNQLEKGAAAGTLRPDEAVSKSNIENAQMPGKALRTAAGLGIGAAFGEGKEGNQQQPSELSTESLSQDAEAMNQAPIETSFPQVIKFIEDRIQAGESPQMAAMAAKQSRSLGGLIQRMEKQNGMNFEQWVMHKYGGQQGQRNQGAPSRDQFLAGLGQMGQMLQGLKGRR